MKAPIGYEFCEVDECTHALTATGRVLNAIRVGYSVRVLGTDIHSNVWDTFGIKPLRKVEVKPIEFVGEVMSYDARAYETLYLEIPDNIKKQWKAGMKFKCVQVMDGEE